MRGNGGKFFRTNCSLLWLESQTDCEPIHHTFALITAFCTFLKIRVCVRIPLWSGTPTDRREGVPPLAPRSSEAGGRGRTAGRSVAVADPSPTAGVGGTGRTVRVREKTIRSGGQNMRYRETEHYAKINLQYSAIFRRYGLVYGRDLKISGH